MSKVAITDTYLTNIANTIRTKLGSQDTYLPSEMADAINEISVGEHTGAYKVDSVAEMNAIDDMENGDYCIVEKASNVPSDYTEVEYIQSGSTQYINTGVIGKSSIKVYAKIQSPTTLSNFKTIIGSHYVDTRVFIQTSNNGAGWSFGANGYSNAGNVSANTDYEIEAIYSNNAYLKVNGNIVATITNASSYTTGLNLTLFARNTGNELNNYSTHKLYNLKIYDNDTLVRDFVPCYKKSNNVIGLYDKVNNTFYTNAGSGSFVKGSDVQTLILYQYNGTTWVQV